MNTEHDRSEHAVPVAVVGMVPTMAKVSLSLQSFPLLLVKMVHSVARWFFMA